MIRWLIFALLLVGCYFAGDWLFAHPGEVQVTWFGYEIAMHIAVLGLLMLLLAAIVSFISIQLWKLATWPSRRKARIQHRTFKRGLEQLTRGVAALAMGNEDVAEEAIAKALLALPGEPLPQLLSAQLLQRQGKHADAHVQFKALMDHSATAELATRRLIEQHVSREEWREATRLAEEARKASPQDRWLVLSLIDFYARDKQTAPMLALTEGWQWKSPLSKEERHRYSALAYYLAAKAETNPRLKQKNLRHAVGYAPDFMPAVIDYAYVLLAEDSPRSARKWLLSAWRTGVSPLLIAPILAALKSEPSRTQLRMLKPFMRGELTATHHLLTARHAIANGELTTARKALDEALELEESKEVATLIADTERKMRNDDSANSWLNRALQAPQGATWVCMSCGTQHDEWQIHCSHCQGFDTLRHERPHSRMSMERSPALHA